MEKAKTRILLDDVIATVAQYSDAQAKGGELVDADSLLYRWSEMFNADLKDILDDRGAFKPIAEGPVVWRRMLSSVETKELYERSTDGGADRWDKIGRVVKLKWIGVKELGELLGKHKAIDAFVQQKQGVEINISVEQEKVREKLASARKRHARIQEAEARALPPAEETNR
jgi:hypothetical protein